MDTALILQLFKADIGMTSALRDVYFTKMINGIITELTDEKGIVLEPENANHVMFIVDYASWKYTGKDSQTGMPDHLRRRMRNLYLHNGGAGV